ncbi:MAG: hypothetical protein ABIS45_13010 [Burkholderiales bacterium]
MANVIQRALCGGTSLVALAIAIRIGKLLTRYRLWRGHPRSLWGITPILTTTLLARSDRLLGIKGESLAFTSYYITQNFDRNLQSFITRRGLENNIYFYRLVLAWALLRYDFFNYFFDRGILPANQLGQTSELSILKRAGKRIYVYPYGADIRTRERTLALGPLNCCMDCPQPGKYCVCDEATGQANIAAVSVYANALIGMGDMVDYIPGCRPMAYWPIDLLKIRYTGVSSMPAKLKIAHSTNHGVFKGSRLLESAVLTLQQEGVAIELIKLSGVPHARVMELFGEADIVADNFIAGNHGYTALEAMAHGKAVLCYLRPGGMIERPAECPIINTHPDKLLEALRWCVDNRSELVRIGLRGRRYIERNHSQEAVAARLGRVYLETGHLPIRLAARLKSEIGSIEQRLATIPLG